MAKALVKKQYKLIEIRIENERFLRLDEREIQFSESRNQKGLAENSRETYIRALKNYADFLKKRNKIGGIKSVKDFLTSIDEPSTHKVSLQALKSFFYKLYDNENPAKQLELRKGFERIRRKKPKEQIGKTGYLTKEQVDEFTEKATKPISLFAKLLFWTGCRISEAVNIKLKKIKMNGGVVTITVLGKGDKERDVFLSIELLKEIKSHFKGKTYLFETRTNKKYSRVFVSHEISRQARIKMELNGISSHIFRHSKSMFLKDRQNLSADQIQKALGHSNVKTTLGYYFHGTPSPEEQGITVIETRL